jgi:hypothetical protein
VDDGAEPDNPLGLFDDLRSPSPPAGRSVSRHVTPEPRLDSSTPIFMAHMTSPSSKGALTRRRYKSLFSPHSTVHHASTRTSPPRPPVQAPEPSQCVVCMSAARQVICWPCRCLTVCDTCRDSMASGASSSSGSRCPCCRRAVEGYSKIFVP